MTGVTLAELDRLRRTPGATILLHLTDRCPVGCAHCNVDSLAGGSRPDDRALFEEVVAGIAAHRTVDVVGITGGEPFVERWALAHAVERFAAAGRRVVVHTSGVWARDGVPDWCGDVLARTATVVLSTDAFHAARIGESALHHVLDAAVGTDTWPIVQTVDTGGAGAAAVGLLRRHFGRAWNRRADVSVIALLPEGRGTGIPDARRSRIRGHAVGRCRTAWSPTVRYDGHLQPCCNTDLLAGRGPGALRGRAASAGEVGAALDAWWADPLLGVVARVGVAGALAHPRLAELADREYDSGCAACWALHARVETEPAARAYVRALAGVAAMPG